MNFYDRNVVPYCIELGCGIPELVPHRRQACAELTGTVLEIGFGSGLNLPYLPPTVERVLAVDPSARSRQLGRRRIAQCRAECAFIGLDAEHIQADSACADSALCTFTLCTVPDPVQALREVRRILKPTGKLFFVEHARAPDHSVQRWQDRLNGLQRALCGGCNLNRDMVRLMEAADFAVTLNHAAYVPKLPRTHAFLVSGYAQASA